jgi:hypothetical protein
MPTRFDCEDEPNEFMDMPCRCDCGNWFDLTDGYRAKNKVVCKECNLKNEEIEVLRDAYYELNRGGKPFKREKAKIIKQLAELGAELSEY